jgi:predicted ABC-type sugar transport system permease subunit
METNMKTITQPVADASRHRSRSRLLSLYRTEIAIAIAIIVMELAVGFIVPAALSVGNVSNVAQASAPLVIMAFGVLLVVITGGIDLSVGSVFSLTGMVTGLAMAHGFGAFVSCAAGLSIGLVIGAINGALVTYIGLAPFVVTLSTYAIAGSLSFIVTDGHSLPISDPNFWLLDAGTLIPGVPNYVLWCAVLLIVIEVCLRKLVAGRWLYAIVGACHRNTGQSRADGGVCPVRPARIVFRTGQRLVHWQLRSDGRLEPHASGDRRGRHRRRQSLRRHGIGDRRAARRVDDHHHPERRESHRRQ